MTDKPKRPSQEDYDRALALYRANVAPESIASRTGLTQEQVDHAMVEGWPPVRGRYPKPALRAFEHVIEDRLHRLELARLDWAQTQIETAAEHAKDWAKTVKRASAIKQAILSAWGMRVQAAMQNASPVNPPAVALLCIDLNTARSLRTLDQMMNPTPQKALSDVLRFLSGVDEDDPEGELDRIQAALDEFTEEDLARWEDEGGPLPEPAQRVIPFPQTGTED